MYSPEDYATKNDFITIINKIMSITSTLIGLGYDITTIPYTDWFENNFLIYDGVKWIEDSIKNIGDGYFRPYGWEDYRTWTFGSAFSYKDLNRWIKNLSLVEERIAQESNELYPSDTLYPNDNLLPH